jgi:hypothetical protein
MNFQTLLVPVRLFGPLWSLPQEACLLTFVDVNPSRNLSEVAPFNSPRPLDEPRIPAHQMRGIDNIASVVNGVTFADDMLQRNQPQTPTYQIFPSEPTTALFPSSNPCSTQTPQIPLAFGRNSQWNESQAPAYPLLPF